MKDTTQDYEFKQGEYVIYKSSGICEITEIRREFFDESGAKDYYKLRSVFDRRMQVFVPCVSELAKKMRHVLKREELDEVIEKSKTENVEWITDPKLRASTYTDILINADNSKTLALFNVLMAKKKELEEKNKQFGASDMRLLTRAEKTVLEEFAFVLGITRDEVVPYLNSKM